MSIDFDFATVKRVEFGIGKRAGKTTDYRRIPIDKNVQEALTEMAAVTWVSIDESEAPARDYSPSEKYGSIEAASISTDDDLAKPFKDIHTAQQIPLDHSALADTATIFCYFAQLTDGANRRLTAMRRASQFKGVLKSRLLTLSSDTLNLVEDKIFKLDSDFDLLIDSNEIHILRPAGFEAIGELDQAILAGVDDNVKAIKLDLAFVNFGSVEAYASKHSRAARLLSAIRRGGQAKNLDRPLLLRQCAATGVKTEIEGGKVVVATGSEYAFLEVIDRRRYDVKLVKDSPEKFRAESRKKI